jgi:arginase
LVYLGIRSVEPAEWAVIENNNILYYEPDEICQMGTDTVINETVQHLSHCDWVFISFDVDVLDAAMVPGTGTPEPDGLSGLQAKELVTGLLKRVKLAAFECTELNPLRDQDGRTTRLVYDLLGDMLPLAREAQRVMR